MICLRLSREGRGTLTTLKHRGREKLCGQFTTVTGNTVSGAGKSLGLNLLLRSYKYSRIFPSLQGKRFLRGEIIFTKEHFTSISEQPT